MVELLQFSIDEIQGAIPIETVSHVIRMVKIREFPSLSPFVVGAVVLHGEMVPVYSLRKRFHLPERPPLTTDLLIILKIEDRTIILMADGIVGVINHEIAPSPAGEQWVRIPGASGFVREKDGIILIHDITAFLRSDDQVSEEGMNEGRVIP